MNGLLGVATLLLCVGIIMLVPGYGAAAVLVGGVLAALSLLAISRAGADRTFLARLFMAALLLRVATAAGTFLFDLQWFFGGDALTYDALGDTLLKVWRGELHNAVALRSMTVQNFYGMPYMVASVYALVGRNPLAIQFVNAVLGAATILPAYLAAQQIFENRRVARITGLLIAFFPSMILWSSQGLKDAPIIFLLALAMLATLRLSRKLSIGYVALLVVSLLGLLSLRFYIFYMVVAAVGGAFLMGPRQLSARSFVQHLVIIACLSLALVQFGVLQHASVQYETFGNLEMVNRSRLDLAQSAESGFGKDVDVSTTEGALSIIPLGLVYLLFAPFPWQVANLRQIITLPEMLAWWGAFPLLVLGLWFTLKYRLRPALPILLFTTMLTLAYSIFQGNVGTAYRQRAQLLIFYFMFVAVGYVLLRERAEERRARGRAAGAAVPPRRAVPAPAPSEVAVSAQAPPPPQVAVGAGRASQNV
jgi:hypothetical protein